MPGFESDDEQTVSSPYSALYSGNPDPSVTTDASSASSQSDTGASKTSDSASKGAARSAAPTETKTGSKPDAVMSSANDRLPVLLPRERPKDVRLAQTREEVTAGQSFLNVMGFKTPIDGKNGPKFRAATLAYQQDWNRRNPSDPIDVDGWMGMGPPGVAQTYPRLAREANDRISGYDRPKEAAAESAAAPATGALAAAQKLAPGAGAGPGRAPVGPTATGATDVLSGADRTGAPGAMQQAIDITKGMPEGYVPTPGTEMAFRDPKEGMALAGGKGVKPIKPAATQAQAWQGTPTSDAIRQAIALRPGNVGGLPKADDLKAAGATAGLDALREMIASGETEVTAPSIHAKALEKIFEPYRGNQGPELVGETTSDRTGDLRIRRAMEGGGIEPTPEALTPPTRRFTMVDVTPPTPTVGYPGAGEPLSKAMQEAIRAGQRPPEGGGFLGWVDRNIRYPLGTYVPPTAAEISPRAAPAEQPRKIMPAVPAPKEAAPVVPGLPSGANNYYNAGEAAASLLGIHPAGAAVPDIGVPHTDIGTPMPYARGEWEPGQFPGFEGMPAAPPPRGENAMRGAQAPAGLSKADQKIFDQTYEGVRPFYLQQTPETQALLDERFTAIGAAADEVMKIPEGPQRVNAWNVQLGQLLKAGVIDQAKYDEQHGKVDNAAIKKASMMNDLIDRLRRDRGAAAPAAGAAMPPIPGAQGALQRARGIQVADGADPEMDAMFRGWAEANGIIQPDELAAAREAWRTQYGLSQPRIEDAPLATRGDQTQPPLTMGRDDLGTRDYDPYEFNEGVTGRKLRTDPMHQYPVRNPRRWSEDDRRRKLDQEFPAPGRPDWRVGAMQPSSALDRARMLVASRNGFLPDETLAGKAYSGAAAASDMLPRTGGPTGEGINLYRDYPGDFYGERWGGRATV